MEVDDYQKDTCSYEQEERVFHQVGVSPGQQRQVGIVFFQLFHPALPRLDHCFEPTERAARRGGCDTPHGVCDTNRGTEEGGEAEESDEDGRHLADSVWPPGGLTVHHHAALLNVEEQEEFENLHCRQKRSEEHTQPGQRLPIYEFKDVPGDIKDRFPPPLQNFLRKQPPKKLSKQGVQQSEDEVHE